MQNIGPDRAVIFVDGNNWYHSFRDHDIANPGGLDWTAVARKLLGPRQLIAIRYYVGRVSQAYDKTGYAEQRRHFSWLTSKFPAMTIVWGRIETRPETNEAARDLRSYANSNTAILPTRVYQDLIALADRHEMAFVSHEKAVDVHLAVDMAVMAQHDDYDAAYLLSADGDFTPAVQAAIGYGKKVFVASPSTGAALASISTAFIPLKKGWFADCYLP